MENISDLSSKKFSNSRSYVGSIAIRNCKPFISQIMGHVSQSTFQGQKNDQYHQGNMAVLDSNDSPYCPVLLTRLYFNRFGLKFGNSDVQDINFVNFKVRNKQITRTVQGV